VQERGIVAALTTSAAHRRRMALVVAAAAVVVAIDQATKTWAQHHVANKSIELFWTLRLRLELNPGIAFSLGRGSTAVVTVVAVGILAVVVVLAWRSTGRLLGIALGLVMGGATGNLVDRLLRHNGGQVIDFIDLRWWPVFNVADMAITCGVILALFATVSSGSTDSSVAAPDPSAPSASTSDPSAAA
jgi:signal peptidase II